MGRIIKKLLGSRPQRLTLVNNGKKTQPCSENESFQLCKRFGKVSRGFIFVKYR